MITIHESSLVNARHELNHLPESREASEVRAQEIFIEFLDANDLDAVIFELDHGQRAAAPLVLVQCMDNLDIESQDEALVDVMSDLTMEMDVYRMTDSDLIDGLRRREKNEFVTVGRVVPLPLTV